MMKFKDLKEAQQAVNDLLGRNLKAMCMRYDDLARATEVISVTNNGLYWIVRFYDDGDIGYGLMDFYLCFSQYNGKNF